jgi:hypothetical protein
LDMNEFTNSLVIMELSNQRIQISVTPNPKVVRNVRQKLEIFRICGLLEQDYYRSVDD